ncbi:unnamed protein product [Rotaria sp. Silwood1]|nr:unnamed protein product [Rotaria sp. Silwood1]
MFISNKNVRFFIFFLIQQYFIFCLKTEIKFHINNVPSLFRCEKNGPLFYFNHFPSDDLFHQTLLENDFLCDLSLLSIDQRSIIGIDQLNLLCEIQNKKNHINEFLLFSSKCSKDLCKKFVPTTASIITQYKTGNINVEKINLVFYGNHSNQLMIGKLTDDKYLRTSSSLHNGDILTNQIVFQYEDNNYVNMMCELRKFEDNLNNFSSSSNGSMSSDLSKVSTFMSLFLILLMCICGICYCNKKKTDKKLINRSSQESQYSPETLDEVFIE